MLSSQQEKIVHLCSLLLGHKRKAMDHGNFKCTVRHASAPIATWFLDDPVEGSVIAIS